MNKKTLIAIIVVPIVLFLIVGIIGARYIFKPKDVSVTGVEFTNVSTDGDSKNLVIDLDSSSEYQLQWKILPENATNKEVVFKYDGDSQISVDKNGKITVNADKSTPEPFYTGSVVISTKDGGKTDSVYVSTTTQVPQNVTFNSTTNTLNGVDYNSETGRYYFKQGRNYVVTSTEDIDVSFEENETIKAMKETDNEYVEGAFKIVGGGAFKLTINKADGSSQEIDCEGVVGVAYLGLPDELSEQQSGNYKVGCQNNFYYNYKIIGSTDFVKYEILKDEQLLTAAQMAEVVEIVNEREIKFKPTAVGKTYTVRLSSTLDSQKKIDFGFNIIDAWNVRNHNELSLAFNEGASQKSQIVLTGNIQIKNSDLSDAFFAHNSYSTTYGNAKGIYTRYKDLQMEGNGHQISGSSLKFFAGNLDNSGDDKFGHERPSLFHIAKYDANGTNSTMFKEFYWTDEFKQMANSIGDDPTYTNTSTGERLAIRNRQAEYVKSLYNEDNTIIPKIVFNNVKMEGNGGKNVADEEGKYMGFRALCGVKANGAKLYLNDCTVEKFLDGVKGDSAISISIKNSTVGNMSGFDVYTTRTRFVTIENSTLGQAGHVAVLMTPSGSDTYVDRFTIYEGVYDYQQNPNAYYDQTTGLPIASIPGQTVTNTVDGAVDTKGQVLKLIGNVVFDNWFNLKGPFLEADKTSYANAQLIKNTLTQMLGNNSAIIFKNYTEANKDDALMNYAIQLESAGSPTNYTYLDVSEISNRDRFRESYDATTFHKLMISAQVNLGADIKNSRINDEIMCVGANFKKLINAGEFYLSSIIVGINKDSNFHLA